MRPGRQGFESRRAAAGRLGQTFLQDGQMFSLSQKQTDPREPKSTVCPRWSEADKRGSRRLFLSVIPGRPEGPDPESILRSAGSKLPQRLEQHAMALGPQPLDQPRLVLVGQRLGARKQPLALARQPQRVAAAVGRGGQALG